MAIGLDTDLATGLPVNLATGLVIGLDKGLDTDVTTSSATGLDGYRLGRVQTWGQM